MHEHLAPLLFQVFLCTFVLTHSLTFIFCGAGICPIPVASWLSPVQSSLAVSFLAASKAKGTDCFSSAGAHRETQSHTTAFCA